MWIAAGMAHKARNISVHSMALACGPELCSVLPATLHLSGADYTSKVCTKLSALNANPERYLSKFGHGKNWFTNFF